MDKKGIAKIGILTFLAILFLIGAIYVLAAAVVDNNDNFTNNSFINGSQAIGYRVIGDQATYNCTLWHNYTSGSWLPNVTVNTSTNNTLNNTITNVTMSGFGSDREQVVMAVNCIQAVNTSSSVWSTNRTFRVDVTGPVVNLNNPSNASTQSDDDVVFGFTGTDTYPDTCTLRLQMPNGSWNNTVRIISYANNTGTNFSSVSLTGLMGTSGTGADGQWNWSVSCLDQGGNIRYNSSAAQNYTFNLLTSGPTITLSSPDNTWSTTENVTFSANITSPNADTCILYHDINGTFAGNQTDTSIVRNKMNNFTVETINVSIGKSFTWNYRCNNTAGTAVFANSNFSFGVDDLVPTLFNVTGISGSDIGAGRRNRTMTDPTPKAFWGQYVEDNFDRIELMFDNDSGFGSPEVMMNITSSNLNATLTTSLSSKNGLPITRYYVNATVFDDAGNSMTSANPAANPLQYHYMGACSNLPSGYAFCAEIRDDVVNLSTIANETGAEIVYAYNSSHDWVTHTAGSSTNAQYNVSRGDAIALYLNVSGLTWQGDRHHPYNTSTDGSPNSSTSSSGFRIFNFTNNSGTGGAWNAFAPQNLTGFNLQEFAVLGLNSTAVGSINATADGNFTFFSWANASQTNATLYRLPYIYNFGVNNNTVVNYGEFIWVYFNGASGRTFNRTVGLTNHNTSRY